MYDLERWKREWQLGVSLRTRMDDGVADAENDARNERRVKWNRGLATTLCFDDTPPNPRRAPGDAPVKKGCLAPSAKVNSLFSNRGAGGMLTVMRGCQARPLDTMGNVLNADAPVPEVQPENIVVKKFVYEDDEVVVPEPAPAKATRSKSKKSRT